MSLNARVLLDFGRIGIVEILEPYKVKGYTLYQGLYMRLPTKQKWYSIDEMGGKLRKIKAANVLEGFYCKEI